MSPTCWPGHRGHRKRQLEWWEEAKELCQEPKKQEEWEPGSGSSPGDRTWIGKAGKKGGGKRGCWLQAPFIPVNN